MFIFMNIEKWIRNSLPHDFGSLVIRNKYYEVINKINKLTEDYTNLYNNPKAFISSNKKGLFSKLFGKWNINHKIF